MMKNNAQGIDGQNGNDKSIVPFIYQIKESEREVCGGVQRMVLFWILEIFT